MADVETQVYFASANVRDRRDQNIDFDHDDFGRAPEPSTLSESGVAQEYEPTPLCAFFR